MNEATHTLCLFAYTVVIPSVLPVVPIGIDAIHTPSPQGLGTFCLYVLFSQTLLRSLAGKNIGPQKLILGVWQNS